MKSFILENWRLIVDILSVIIVTIFFFIKKKPNKVIDTIKASISCVLPGLINEVEKTGLTGEEKKHLVLHLLTEFCLSHDVPLTDYYKAFASKMIEDILSTPHKKEV